MRVFSLEGESAYAGRLPDVDEMREVYKAARVLTRRPMHAPDMEALVHALAEEAGMDATKCHASLLALMDMQLLALREKPFGLMMLPMQKKDPETSAVWRTIQKLKMEIEGRGLT